jgi:hypothetical protein
MKQGLEELISGHTRLHPSLRARDVYKLLYQGTMGPRHLIRDPRRAMASLRKELKSVGQCRGTEPLIEQVSVDGAVVRINLRPFKEFSDDRGALFGCMCSSARRIVPDEEQLRTLWSSFRALNGQEILNFDPREVSVLHNRLSREGFTALSHSREYTAREQPSYRVVLLECLTEIRALPLIRRDQAP